MTLLDYIYFLGVEMLRRQKRDDPYEHAQNIIVGTVGVYSVGLVALLYHATGFQLWKVTEEVWPRFAENMKFLKPAHSLGLITGIATIVLVARHYKRGPRIEEIERRFKSVSSNALERSWRSVFGFMLTAPIFFFSAVTQMYSLLFLVVVGLWYWNRQLDSAYPRVDFQKD